MFLGVPSTAGFDEAKLHNFLPVRTRHRVRLRHLIVVSGALLLARELSGTLDSIDVHF